MPINTDIPLGVTNLNYNLNPFMESMQNVQTARANSMALNQKQDEAKRKKTIAEQLKLHTEIGADGTPKVNQNAFLSGITNAGFGEDALAYKSQFDEADRKKRLDFITEQNQRGQLEDSKIKEMAPYLSAISDEGEQSKILKDEWKKAGLDPNKVPEKNVLQWMSDRQNGFNLSKKLFQDYVKGQSQQQIVPEARQPQAQQNILPMNQTIQMFQNAMAPQRQLDQPLPNAPLPAYLQQPINQTPINQPRTDEEIGRYALATGNTEAFKQYSEAQKALREPNTKNWPIVTLHDPSSGKDLTFERNPETHQLTLLGEARTDPFAQSRLTMEQQKLDMTKKTFATDEQKRIFDALPIENQETIKDLAKKNANKTTIANQIKGDQYKLSEALGLDSNGKPIQGKKVDEDRALKIANGMIKTLNSKEGADAVGVEEAGRLATALQFQTNPFNLKGGQRIGRDLSAFYTQINDIYGGIINGINENKKVIEQQYGKKETKPTKNDPLGLGI